MNQNLPKNDIQAAIELLGLYGPQTSSVGDYLFCRGKGCTVEESLAIVHKVQIKALLDSAGSSK